MLRRLNIPTTSTSTSAPRRPVPDLLLADDFDRADTEPGNLAGGPVPWEPGHSWQIRAGAAVTDVHSNNSVVADMHGPNVTIRAVLTDAPGLDTAVVVRARTADDDFYYVQRSTRAGDRGIRLTQKLGGTWSSLRTLLLESSSVPVDDLTHWIVTVHGSTGTLTAATPGGSNMQSVEFTLPDGGPAGSLAGMSGQRGSGFESITFSR